MFSVKQSGRSVTHPLGLRERAGFQVILVRTVWVRVQGFTLGGALFVHPFPIVVRVRSIRDRDNLHDCEPCGIKIILGPLFLQISLVHP